MNLSELKVGQVVRHSEGFIGKIISIENSTVYIEVTESNGTSWSKGLEYRALAMYIEEVISEPSEKHKLTVDVEVNGLNDVYENLVEIESQLTDIRLEAEAISQLQKEESVFEVEFGQGIKFKGTKSDYEVFMEGWKALLLTGVTFNS